MCCRLWPHLRMDTYRRTKMCMLLDHLEGNHIKHDGDCMSMVQQRKRQRMNSATTVVAGKPTSSCCCRSCPMSSACQLTSKCTPWAFASEMGSMQARVKTPTDAELHAHIEQICSILRHASGTGLTQSELTWKAELRSCPLPSGYEHLVIVRRCKYSTHCVGSELAGHLPAAVHWLATGGGCPQALGSFLAAGVR